MNHAVDILDAGGWLNIYAEGKCICDIARLMFTVIYCGFTGRVNEFPPELLPFKWGVARLIMDAREPPVVLPIYHEGIPIMELSASHVCD